MNAGVSAVAQRTRILICAAAIALLLAVIDALWPEVVDAGTLDLVVAVAFGICAFAWVKADAAARKIEPPAGSALLAGLVIPVGVPVYLFRALGFRRGLWAASKALGFMLAVAIGYVLVLYIAELMTWHFS